MLDTSTTGRNLYLVSRIGPRAYSKATIANSSASIACAVEIATISRDTRIPHGQPTFCPSIIPIARLLNQRLTTTTFCRRYGARRGAISPRVGEL